MKRLTKLIISSYCPSLINLDNTINCTEKLTSCKECWKNALKKQLKKERTEQYCRRLTK